MSAFMCDDRHISALACYADQHDITPSGYATAGNGDAAAAMARTLHKANALSLTARYGDPDDPPFTFQHVNTRNVPPVNVIKAAHCFDYQACEDPSWETSEAKKLIDRIVSHATHRLPGYDAAPWGWD